MLRNVGAVLLGLIAGSCVNMALILLNSYVLFPMPEGMDMNDADQMNAYIATLPAVAFLVVIVAHLGQAFVGGWIAARLGKSRPMVLAMILGVLTLAGGVMNAMTLTTPTWMYIELPLYLVVAWAAGTLEVRRRATAAS
jgi:MFS family permease